ncbi:MAG TPA: hypothetical protein GX733_07360 [Tissierellia bacterium]|nr:hypothetical protein [Tissierellia bacterium]
MDISKNKDAMVILIAVLWLACIVLGTIGYHVLAMCLGVVLMLLHALLGVAHNDVVNKKFLVYPLLIWAGLWIASFLLSGYYGDLFAGQMPSFTVLGLHPSFAPTVFFYWIGGQLTLNLGLYLYADKWLSEEQWEQFLDKVKSLKEVE